MNGMIIDEHLSLDNYIRLLCDASIGNVDNPELCSKIVKYLWNIGTRKQRMHFIPINPESSCSFIAHLLQVGTDSAFVTLENIKWIVKDLPVEALYVYSPDETSSFCGFGEKITSSIQEFVNEWRGIHI
eukprot:TRINITY_DN43990_c0_g1_i1.p1 TRINITY_DN43990_c0_g1~~TRINITY_DN43990_c0_g1_i1.p1  ORF type:complete len:129 (+),score=17.87 TRINITY_DN43990_c0_g1_i1:76-462(+)